MRIARTATVLLFGAAMLLGLACGGGADWPVPAPPPGYQNYVDRDNGFSIAYPLHWEVSPEEFWLGTDVALLGPVICNSSVPNLNLLSLNVPKTLGLQDLFADSEAYWETEESYESISIEETAIGGAAAIKHVYTWGPDEDAVQQMQVYFIENQKARLLTFTSIPSCWSQVWETFDTMADSFRIWD